MTGNNDDMAHPVGAAAIELAKAGAKIADEADAARAAGDTATAAAKDVEAAQHYKIANELDVLDEAYGIRNSE